MASPLIFVSELGRYPVAHMLDVDGDMTDDPALAVGVVTFMPDGRWLAAQCRPGEIQDGGAN